VTIDATIASTDLAPRGLAFGPCVADASGTLHRPFRFFSRDGLVLAGRDYAPLRPSDRPPVVCLPGLTRNARDFEPVIARLVAGGPTSPTRRVVTFDFRGRGASQYGDAATYTPLQELDDTRLGLAALGIDHITAFGTSRGGIVTMLSALVAPGLVTTAVLNDIGAVIEPKGLLRIKGYVGRPLPEGTPWEALVAAMIHVNRAEYPRLDGAGWERFARRLYRDVGGRPALDYDPALTRTLAAVDEATPIPDLWAPFEALAGVPTLVVRGGLSDLLSRETVAEMAARHPRFDTFEVPDEGHAPLFDDATSQDALIAHLDRVGA
jgi:pimeloyl-ACP methyl ester carboxylesterase